VLAGALGSAGGITSLISYPALLLVGVPPLAANATNIVALTTFWPGSALGSQRELTGRRDWILGWTPLALLGGAAGAGLLLLTPPDAFQRVVPLLVLAGTAALVCAPWLTRRRGAGQVNAWALGIWLALLAAYSGYFGAGSGVMTLALLLVTVEQHLPTANALKNMFVGAATVPAGILIAIFGSVHWAQAAALAVGVLIGSRLGPGIARGLPADLLRWGVALLGAVLAVWLWVDPTA
jgi:hypothetical protein